MGMKNLNKKNYNDNDDGINVNKDIKHDFDENEEYLANVRMQTNKRTISRPSSL